MPFVRLPLVLGLGVVLAVGPEALVASTPCAFTFKLKTHAVYRVDFATLAAAAEASGLAQEPAAGHPTAPKSFAPLPADRLHLTQGGSTVPIWVEDGGDGLFGPGDSLQLIGHPLRGVESFFDERVEWNAYRLDACRDLSRSELDAARIRRAERPATMPAFDPKRLRVSEHLEENHLMLRFNQPTPEQWYWLRMTHADGQARDFQLDLRAHRPDLGPVALQVELRGWSYQSGRRHGVADHRIEVAWNGQVLGTWDWDGQEVFKVDLPALDPQVASSGLNRLSLRVPERKLDSGESIVDVVVLNWIKLDFPSRPALFAAQQRLALAPSPKATEVQLRHASSVDVVVYDDRGHRWDDNNLAPIDEAGMTRISLAVPAEVGALLAVSQDQIAAVPVVEVDLASNLRDVHNRADYLMITHPSLKSALMPLADFHRARGLEVEVVDISDIYDEFSYGLPFPEAIRDFIAHAFHEWQKPAPRFVLLAGDASWDTQNEEAADENYADWTYQPGEVQHFLKNSSTPYADGVKDRNLIPAWGYESLQGRAAGDNYFVTVAGDDNLPDLAIGRIPVVEPSDLAAVVGKTIRYADQAGKVGPWRRRMVWITNEEAGFQTQTEILITNASARGYEPVRVYPKDSETSNELHQAALRAAFDSGQLLVHFYGHGGRYIWRTGPPDLRKNHDLFTLEDIDKLQPTDQLPVVLSMSCYSAPFDHPTADSIGEKFLRVDRRGAIAVIAASWRNAPALEFSKSLVQELSTPGVTIGEALRRAKTSTPIVSMIEQYNLLGDPAIEMSRPSLAVELSPGSAPAGTISVAGRVTSAESFSGQALVEWLDGGGRVVAEKSAQVEAGRLTASLDAALAPAEVRVYVWNEEVNLDGLGSLKLEPVRETTVQTTSPTAFSP